MNHTKYIPLFSFRRFHIQSSSVLSSQMSETSETKKWNIFCVIIRELKTDKISVSVHLYSIYNIDD